MPYYFDLQKQEVIFSRYEYTPQYLDGEWINLPQDDSCYAIKNGQAIFEGSPEEAFSQGADKVVLKNQGSLPVYKPDTVINIVNDVPSTQTVEQQDLLEYLQAELIALKSGQQTTVTTYENHDQLITSLANQIEVLTTALANAPSQKTIEQQTAIDFLTAELAKLKETDVIMPVAVDAGNQDLLITSLENNFQALTTLLSSGIAPSAEFQTLQTQIDQLASTTSNTSQADFSEQGSIITSLLEKIESLEAGTGPSDLTLQQETVIDTLKVEILGIKEEYQQDLVAALNSRIDDLTALLAATPSSTTSPELTPPPELASYLQTDLAWNIVNLKSEIEKLKTNELNLNPDEQFKNLTSYLDALVASLAAEPQSASAVSAPQSLSSLASPNTSNSLTDGYFVFEDSSTPLYTYSMPRIRHT